MSDQENHLPGSVAVYHIGKKPLILVSAERGRALYTNTTVGLPKAFLPFNRRNRILIWDDSLGFLTYIKNIIPSRGGEFDFEFADGVPKYSRERPGYRILIFPDSKDVFSVAPNGGLMTILSGSIRRIEKEMGYTYHHRSVTSS